ncbi:MAG: alpha-amylase family glycosyl hydrolase [Chloroflexota bacterium]|nr:alpha-amylase family glycosyl hydrolase [Chloroflexota bacterium]
MQRLPMPQLGARERDGAPGVIDFGVLLPGITPDVGTLFVRIIHERDQFIEGIPAVDVQLTHSQLAGLGDYWSGVVDTTDPDLKPAGARGWGNMGGEQRYVYRYVLKRGGQEEIDNIIDPFAREYGVGDLSAITVGYQPFEFDEAVEESFKVPSIKDAIVYELNIAELGGDIPKTIELLDYIADLGINVIEVMPVSNVASRVDWGYAPIGYFGVDERLGKRRDFQVLVGEAHRRGIAVVLDGVFGHVEDRFPYHYLYNLLGASFPGPFIGKYAEDLFFQSTDFTKPLTRDFFYTVCLHWLDTYHIDGFRYDAVSQYWDESKPVGEQGFSDLAREVRAYVAGKIGATDEYQRFFPTDNGEMTFIQIAEYLAKKNPPEHVLYDTVANSAWQNQTMEAAERCAQGVSGALSELGLRFGLHNYPDLRTHDGEVITKSALQYIESHDHERFICTFGTEYPDPDSAERRDELVLVGKRKEHWFKIQPYLIGLLTAKGTPFLWEGQEFCQNYFVPGKGMGRVVLYRPVDFNFFYDSIGRTLIRLVRKLTRIRNQGPQFRRGDHYFYDRSEYTHLGLLLFHRSLTNAAGATTFSLVALNFTGESQKVRFPFPVAGDYVEQLLGQHNLAGVAAGEERELIINSNYGGIWTANP